MWFALLLLAPQATDVDRILADYRANPLSVIPCRTTEDSSEIVVCARRDADRYRVPLVEIDPGDPRREGVPAERARYVRTNTPCQDMGPFLIGCGKVGVGVTTSGSGTRVLTQRELAP